MSQPDVIVDNYGSIVGLAPMTQAARDWIEENVATESWQWLGGVLNVESRYAADLVVGMQEAELIVQ